MSIYAKYAESARKPLYLFGGKDVLNEWCCEVSTPLLAALVPVTEVPVLALRLSRGPESLVCKPYTFARVLWMRLPVTLVHCEQSLVVVLVWQCHLASAQISSRPNVFLSYNKCENLVFHLFFNHSGLKSNNCCLLKCLLSMNL